MNHDNLTAVLALASALAVFVLAAVQLIKTTFPVHGRLLPLRFTDVDVRNSVTGRAAGNGFLIGTSDGGNHFQEIYSGQWTFRQIEFPDNVHGWALAAVGDEAPVYLIRTSDGGAHWQRLGNKSVPYERIDFLDAKRGFAYARAFTYYTDDGGDSWTRVPTPPNTRGAVFTSRSQGWASVVDPAGKAYRIMKTADGGSTWSLSLKVPYDAPAYSELYAGGSQVWAVLYGGSGMTQTSYSLYASSNGGTSWKRVIAQETAGGGPAPGTGGIPLKQGPAKGKPGGMTLLGSGTAFLTAYSPSGERVAVGRSSDGGSTWINEAGVGGYEGVSDFADADHGWLAVQGTDGKAILYVTSDGGETWQPKLSFPPE